MRQATNAKLLARVRRLKGQVEAVERALESDADTPAVLMLVAAVRGAVTGLCAGLVERHIVHGIGAIGSSDEREKAAHEVAEMVRTYIK